MIEIDGSKHESGGKVLRTACLLSAITGKACRVFNIGISLHENLDLSRTRPGLTVQHLLELQALRELCNGKLEGDYLESQEIKFYPGNFSREQTPVNILNTQAKELQIKIEAAGSITLILQTLIPPALFSPSPTKIIFKGGTTDTFFSPTMDYFQYVFLKALSKIGAKMKINIIKRGFYPEGGAKVEIIIYPSKLKPLNLTKRGELKRILLMSGASEFLRNRKVAERQTAGAKEILGKLKLPIEEKVKYYDIQCLGSQICIIAEFENTTIGTDNLGKLGKKAESVGKEAALELLKKQRSDACLDKYSANQILPYLALTAGKSKITVPEVTSHCKANIQVIEKFLDRKFKIRPYTKTGSFLLEVF